MMIAVIALVWRLSTTDVERVLETASTLPFGVQAWMFAGFALAFAIKVPVLPFHTWLPDAHTEAPTSGPSCWPACCSRWGPTACCASASRRSRPSRSRRRPG
jgi:NADH:ubiquinone oxidoreductase subunit 4 (subunit M)